MKTRAEYEAASLSRAQPWKARGSVELVEVQKENKSWHRSGSNKVSRMDRPDLCQQVGDVLESRYGCRGFATTPFAHPTVCITRAMPRP